MRKLGIIVLAIVSACIAVALTASNTDPTSRTVNFLADNAQSIPFFVGKNEKVTKVDEWELGDQDNGVYNLTAYVKSGPKERLYRIEVILKYKGDGKPPGVPSDWTVVSNTPEEVTQ